MIKNVPIQTRVYQCDHKLITLRFWIESKINFLYELDTY